MTILYSALFKLIKISKLIKIYPLKGVLTITAFSHIFISPGTHMLKINNMVLIHTHPRSFKAHSRFFSHLYLMVILQLLGQDGQLRPTPTNLPLY